MGQPENLKTLLFNAIRTLRRFTYAEASSASGASLVFVNKTCLKLEKEGVLKRVAGGVNGEKVVMELIRPEALLEAGSATSQKPQEAHNNMWTAMRQIGDFTPTDLSAAATTELLAIDQATAMAYCQLLTRAGYLRVVRKARPNRREAAYRLIRNTGPFPPKAKRVRGVYDQNLGEFTYIAGAGL